MERAAGVVLVEDVVPPVPSDQPVRVVQPVSGWREVVLGTAAGAVLAGVIDPIAEPAHVVGVGRASGRPVVDGEASEAAGNEAVARPGKPRGVGIVDLQIVGVIVDTRRIGEQDGRAESDDCTPRPAALVALPDSPRDRRHLVRDRGVAAERGGERFTALGEHALVPDRRDRAALPDVVSESLQRRHRRVVGVQRPPQHAGRLPERVLADPVGRDRLDGEAVDRRHRAERQEETTAGSEVSIDPFGRVGEGIALGDRGSAMPPERVEPAKRVGSGSAVTDT